MNIYCGPSKPCRQAQAAVRRQPAPGTAHAATATAIVDGGTATLPARRLRGDDDRFDRRRRRRLPRHDLQVVRRQARPGPSHPRPRRSKVTDPSRPSSDPTSCTTRGLDRPRDHRRLGCADRRGRAASRARSCCSSAPPRRPIRRSRRLLEEMDADRLRRMTDNARRLRDAGHLRRRHDTRRRPPTCSGPTARRSSTSCSCSAAAGHRGGTAVSSPTR